LFKVLQNKNENVLGDGSIQNDRTTQSSASLLRKQGIPMAGVGAETSKTAPFAASYQYRGFGKPNSVGANAEDRDY